MSAVIPNLPVASTQQRKYKIEVGLGHIDY